MNNIQYYITNGGWRLLPRRIKTGLILTTTNSYVHKMEWQQLEPGRAPKRPLPWLPYPLIRILDDKLPVIAKVLEIGMGWGTVFWDQRQIVAPEYTESDYGWRKRIEPYLKHAKPFESRFFDLIIVDNEPRWREETLEKMLSHISRRGVIVLDDTHRVKERKIGATILQDWKSLYIEGLGPWSQQVHGSTIYYREGNVLGL